MFPTYWMIPTRESAALAERLIAETCQKQEIVTGTLTVHADQGSSMTSKTVALLADPGVTKSHSRPHVSNDNPFSESQFRTMKYQPGIPRNYGCIQDARATWGPLSDWYNTEHRHSGIGYHTPESVHYGLAAGIREQLRGVGCRLRRPPRALHSRHAQAADAADGRLGSHVTLCYITSQQSAAPIVGALGKALPAREVTIDKLTLAIQHGPALSRNCRPIGTAYLGRYDDS